MWRRSFSGRPIISAWIRRPGRNDSRADSVRHRRTQAQLHWQVRAVKGLTQTCTVALTGQSSERADPDRHSCTDRSQQWRGWPRQAQLHWQVTAVKGLTQTGIVALTGHSSERADPDRHSCTDRSEQWKGMTQTCTVALTGHSSERADPDRHSCTDRSQQWRDWPRQAQLHWQVRAVKGLTQTGTGIIIPSFVYQLTAEGSYVTDASTNRYTDIPLYTNHSHFMYADVTRL